jgi:ribosome recycling factor
MGLMDIYGQTKPRMQEVVDKFADGLKTIHTGRASALLVEDIQVDYYGSRMPIKQVANIGTPDATLITITPWDKGAMGPIESAIRDSGRNLNPVNDGATIRISLPPMSQERREELVKLVHKMAEESRVSLRNARKDAWEKVQNDVKAGELTEDDKYDGEKDLNKMIDDFNAKIAEMVTVKEKEIRTI